ncbi:MAG: patatin-like phospholipase family protein [Okeania sp. SIO2C9]|nr:CBASS cGAMP-activated phospholipase [Okeania sp. SIO2C9]NEQ71674.1 patatin-like phospholipase family protein [Okeania sp. SIO2C9]
MTFRILCLDGGGIRGVMPARILEKIEEQLGGRLKDHFDLIAGTSTGSILAVGIALGKSPKELYNLYFEKGLQIFPYQKLFSPKRLPLIFKYGLSAPKFSDEGLISVLKEQFGEATFADLTPKSDQGKPPLKVLVPSYDTIARNPIMFKSWFHHRWYAQVPVWEICVSSASAPTYFPAHRIEKNGQVYSLIDGGVCANNPVSCAVAEAIRILRESPNQSLGSVIDQIQVISIGTGDPASPIPWEEVRAWGLVQWGLRIADVFMDAPPDVHRYVAEQIIGVGKNDEEPRYIRLQLPLKDPLLAMDDARETNLQALLKETDRYLDQEKERLEKFLANW